MTDDRSEFTEEQAKEIHQETVRLLLRQLDRAMLRLGDDVAPMALAEALAKQAFIVLHRAGIFTHDEAAAFVWACAGAMADVAKSVEQQRKN